MNNIDQKKLAKFTVIKPCPLQGVGQTPKQKYALSTIFSFLKKHLQLFNESFSFALLT